ncbi:MAG: iron ABC transporter permease [Clostridia bacterium]|jgi:iron complex transport system permease protein|nr:iron ABC transporter permease [Clostridia bacterium]MCI2014336.1 iron ABC transporter permease [Clostridia bacterium]
MSVRSITENYYKIAAKNALWIVVAVAILFFLSVTACTIGIADLSFSRIAVTYLPYVHNIISAQPLSATEQNVLVMLRLPRVAAAIVAGAGLGVSGTAMQAITGNQMASPFTTGISGAAALGAAMIIVFGSFPVYTQKAAMVAAAFLMAMLCAVLVYGISALKGLKAVTLVLAGIALNYFFSAVNSTMQFIANEEQLPAIIHWTFGSLTGVTWADISVMACFFVLFFPIIYLKAWALNLISANGDNGAAALGVNVIKTRLIVGLGITLITASVVSFTGIIGFVGLVAPHISRILVGGNYRQVIPFSALSGAMLVLVADTVGRNAFSPTTIPVGIMVSYVGVPLFLYLILRERSEQL